MAAPISNTLPFYLFPGQVAIYGPGSLAGTSGITPIEQSFKFGFVYQTGGDVLSQIGDSVLFKDGTQLCTVKVHNWPYIIIEATKLIITEVPPT